MATLVLRLFGSTRSNVALVGLAACLMAGCSDSSSTHWTPVMGRVIIDGKPLTHGVVRFAPQGARQSMGALDETGNFTLGSYEADDGAVVGTHRVSIVAREQISETKAKWYAPKHYSSYQTSGLTVEVADSSEPVTIELTWGKRSGPFVEID